MFVVHMLGSVDLLWTDPDTSPYWVEDVANPPEEEVDEAYVMLNDGAGARLAHFAIGKAPHVLEVLCLGTDADDQAGADAAREALQDEIDLAISGSVVTYQYQESVSQPSPTVWRVVGGIVRPRWRDSQGQQIFGLKPVGASVIRAVAPARVVLNLSRG